MKSEITLSGNGGFSVKFFPQTPAETALLKRAGEHKFLACYFNEPSWGNEPKCLEMYPTIAPAAPLCEHGYNGGCPTCSALQTPPAKE